MKTGNDLYQKSGENSDYESGWVVNNIGAAVGDEFIEFQNGEVLELGEALGDVNEEVVKRAQIRRTIEDHLARQFELWPRGVKVLSLFFIDRVDRYRVYEPEVHGGLYALMFEEEYAGALNSKAPRRIAKAAGIGKGTWLECYEAVGAPLVRDPHAVHQGYFAKDKKGKFKGCKVILLHTEEDFTGEDLEKFKLCEKMAAKGKIRVKEDGMWFNVATIKVDYSDSGGANN